MLSSRAEAITIAQEKLANNPLFLDTETTGLDVTSEIVEICIVEHDGEILYESLVKPSRSIPFDALRIHGISDPMVQNAPYWIQVWEEVKPILNGRHVGIYNADFDLRMIRQSNAKYRLSGEIDSTFFCIMNLYAQFYGSWNSARGSYRWHSLEAAGRQCGIPLPNTHRAKDDTLLARAVLLYMSQGDQ
jgi:DNA polymerase-3 subunit epsilon